MHKLTDSVSAGLSAGQATLQAFQNMTHNLDIFQKSLPNFSQVVGKIKSLSEAIYQLTQSKKLEQVTQSFAKIFSQNNLSNMSTVLDNLSSLGKKNQFFIRSCNRQNCLTSTAELREIIQFGSDFST